MSTDAEHPRIALFGHFGSANVGNESTLLAILTRLRQIHPAAEFRCICSDPAAVTARDGIQATPITIRTRRIWDRALPPTRRVPMIAAGLLAELREYARAYRVLRDTSMLLVPGTGLLTDAYGLARWGPYSLFKWILVAKLRRAEVLLVSVGAGPVDGTAGRLLVRAALSLADYRSYRDQASKDVLSAIGLRTAADPVYPDLVFGLPERLLAGGRRPASPTPAGAPAVVGLGLMVSAERYSARHTGPETYGAYLAGLADFTIWLLARGHRIRLLLGDADTVVIDDFRAVLARRAGGIPDPARVIERPITSASDLLAELAACDEVVATRFHNVLLAMLLQKPVIAISFHHKCASLMREMGLSEYTHDIHELDAGRLIEQFRALERDRDAVTARLDQGVRRARQQLDEQYERLFATGG